MDFKAGRGIAHNTARPGRPSPMKPVHDGSKNTECHQPAPAMNADPRAKPTTSRRRLLPAQARDGADAVESRSTTPVSAHSAGSPSSAGRSRTPHDGTIFIHNVVVSPGQPPVEIPDQAGLVTLAPKGTPPSAPEATHHRSFHPPELWESHKEAIRRLYIDENKPLREVTEAMEQRGFYATSVVRSTGAGRWVDVG